MTGSDIVIQTGELVFNNNMLASAIILAVTFIGIFTEELHHIHRTTVAMVGAGAMVIVGQIMGFYNPDLALHAIDWNVVLLLGAMMTIVAIMAPTGGFEAIAYSIAKFSKGRQFLLVAMLGVVISGLSMILDNVTTVVIFGPLIVIICQQLRVSPVPYLMAAAILSNTGGIATLVGDPPNLMIGSAADIDFNTFVTRMFGIVVVCWAATLLALRFVFNKNLSKQAKQIKLESKEFLTDRYTWFTAIAVLAVMVGLFIMHGALHWEAWVVAAFGLTALMFATHHVAHPDERYAEVELTLLLFFVSLFVVVGGVEHSQFLMWVGQFIKPFVETDMLIACIILLWVSAFLSAAIDNIPFTAAMIPIILGMEAQGINVTPLWWVLSLGVGLGGNGSHLGSTANVFVVTVSERLARKEADPSLRITPGFWLKKGTPIMLFTLLVGTGVFILFFDFFSVPFNQ
jgi:Na+/H+ antiporter NhaD/arsenite permease-like protein